MIGHLKEAGGRAFVEQWELSNQQGQGLSFHICHTSDLLPSLAWFYHLQKNDGFRVTKRVVMHSEQHKY